MQRSLFLFFFLPVFCANSQINTSLFVDGEFERKLTVSDSLSLTNQIRDHSLQAISQGHYFAGLDSAVQKGDELFIYLYKGEKRQFELEEFGRRKFQKTLRRRLRYLSNHGYPFALVKVDSIRMSETSLSGKLVEEKGPHIINDSSFFYNPIKTKSSYVHSLLDHVPGEQFNEANYKKINERILRSTFLTFRRPADISFQDGKAKLYLDIEENEASSFEGVLGLQQQGTGGTNVVGGLDLNIQNLFRSGKELGISWESFSSESQELLVSYGHPFFLGSKLSPHFQFDLLKQDSLFLKRSTGLDLGMYVSPTIEILVGYIGSTGSLLSTEETSLLSSDVADFSSDLYSIHLKMGRVNKRKELKTDFSWKAGVGLGSKEISENVSIPSTFYDTLELKTDIFRFDLKSVFNKRISQRQQFSQQLEVGLIENSQLLNNERYRLGGLRSIRGFNEKRFFADKYLLSRTELRSFFEKGSFVYLFYDQLFFRNEDFQDAPSGTGLGFVLATLSGQFNFALALGRSKDQPIDFSNMNAHFGYITNF
ncbi:MAG: ShlB/FhaC/HecB family hemolysin secretion/activation protein [Cyclobacteriaceae bacterium]